ncbi:MAG: hypothetical protein SVX38_14940, partial [Chloroflexota bacterium]|nr:hypothetical protein [Chloroflexota bacterium]
VIVLAFSLVLMSCTATVAGDPADPSLPGQPQLDSTPVEEGAPTPAPSHAGRKPSGTGTIQIEGMGEFEFDAGRVQTIRPDVFQPGHFSLFDVLAHLGERGDIELDYHFDEEMHTHVIDAINGQSGWWYESYYSDGWPERNVFRMDMYPYKNGTQTRVFRRDEGQLANIYRTFREEVERLAINGGQVIIPELSIRSPRGSWTFQDVVVTAHDVRSDVLQPGTVTALDALLSLEGQGQLSNLKLTWYESIGAADPVDSYWVEQINEAEARGSCGFVYEVGPRDFAGFAGSHIHIPADVRVIVSPEYEFWFWICL